MLKKKLNLIQKKDAFKFHQYTKHGKITMTGIAKHYGGTFIDIYYIETGDEWAGWYDRDFDVRENNEDKKQDWAFLFQVS